MWVTSKKLISDSIYKYQIIEKGDPISFRKWIRLLQHDDIFIKYFINILKSCPFTAFFWEVKSVDHNSLDHKFEFVLIDSKKLKSTRASHSKFNLFFKKQEDVAVFKNLKKDATLIVPSKLGSSSLQNYAHLASFVRKGSLEQNLNLWKNVSIELKKSIVSSGRTWVSTAGLGVPWLHIRLDSQPKYYKFKDFK